MYITKSISVIVSILLHLVVLHIRPLDKCDGSCFFQYIFSNYGNIFLNHKKSSHSYYNNDTSNSDFSSSLPFNTYWDYYESNDMKWGY